MQALRNNTRQLTEKHLIRTYTQTHKEPNPKAIKRTNTEWMTLLSSNFKHEEIFTSPICRKFHRWTELVSQSELSHASGMKMFINPIRTFVTLAFNIFGKQIWGFLVLVFTRLIGSSKGRFIWMDGRRDRQIFFFLSRLSAVLWLVIALHWSQAPQWSKSC